MADIWIILQPSSENRKEKDQQGYNIFTLVKSKNKQTKNNWHKLRSHMINLETFGGQNMQCMFPFREYV